MKTVLSMWSGPRNISTTMMRSFANREGAAAFDEPFYANYLAASGADHPFRAETLAAYPATKAGVLDWIAREANDGGKDGAKGGELFLKHIAYHLEDDADLSFIDGWRNFILIRDPRAMVASFSNKFDDVTPIIRSYEIALKIADHLAARGLPCPVVDAADVLKAPESVLRSLCGALEIPFRPSMLGWAAGARAEDGPWAPHWYDAVRASTGFHPYVEKKPNLSRELDEIAVRAAPAYQRLAANRLAA